MSLKEKLERLRQSQDQSISDDLLGQMITNIGSLDSELRDTLNYNLFAEAVTAGNLTLKQQQEVTQRLLRNRFLLTNIDNFQDNESIFERSFTALFLAALAYRHNNSPFLSQQQERELIKQTISYLQLEHDFRGLTLHGWAHGIAHSADLIDEIINFQSLNHQDIIAFLTAIKNVLHRPFLFTADEPGRLVVPVQHLSHTKLITDEELTEWLTDLNHINADEFDAYGNVSLFMVKLQSLLLITENPDHSISEAVNHIIKTNYQRFGYL